MTSLEHLDDLRGGLPASLSDTLDFLGVVPLIDEEPDHVASARPSRDYKGDFRFKTEEPNF